MREINFQKFAMLAATLLFAGCASDGDPRAGGIFWSESKARERQQTLRQESRLTWEQAANEQNNNAELRQRRASLRSSIAEQHSRLTAMHGQLSTLGRNSANSEVAGNVAQLERKRANLESSKTENSEQLEGQVRDLQTEIDRLKERNELLKETR
jgi:hypothetical protein